MTHAHITTWLIALILFFVVVSIQSKGKQAKVPKMILRLFYLLIIATGTIILIQFKAFTLMYVLKALSGIWVIGAMEMILAKGSKGQSTKMFWIQLVIAFIVALYLGLSLPIGFDLF